jgi:hypothetical protein
VNYVKKTKTLIVKDLEGLRVVPALKAKRFERELTIAIKQANSF